MSIYENMDFPPYQFRPYPKQLKLRNGTTVVVASDREELLMLAETEGALPSDDPVLAERDALAQKVAELQAELAKTQAAAQAAGEPKAADKPAPTSAKPATPAVL